MLAVALAFTYFTTNVLYAILPLSLFIACVGLLKQLLLLPDVATALCYQPPLPCCAVAAAATTVAFVTATAPQFHCSCFTICFMKKKPLLMLQ